MPKGVYVCALCHHDCVTWMGLSGHILSKHPGTSIPSKESFEHLLKTSKKPLTPKEEPPKEHKEAKETSQTQTVIKPLEASDVSKSPFLAARIEFAKVVEALKEPSSQPNTGTESSKEPVKEPVEESKEGESKETKEVKDVVETQKKQVEASSNRLPLRDLNIYVQTPTSTAEGHRDQPQPEAKPSMMMPLGSITREIEVTTKGMEIQVGSTLLMYYDWLRGRGYERSLSEFINQTVEAYFTEKGLMLGITLRRD